MSMKSKLLLLTSMAEIFASMDRKMAIDEKKREGLGGFRKLDVKSESHGTPKTKKRRAKNKQAKASRRKNRKH